MTEPVTMNELQPSNDATITRRSNLNEHQTLNLGQELVTALRVSTQANVMSEQSVRKQASQQQNRGRDLEEQQHAREQAPNVGQTRTVHEVTTAKTPSSDQHKGEQGRTVSCFPDWASQDLYLSKACAYFYIILSVKV